MIKVVCKECKKKINAPEKYAGKKVKCPGCKSSLKIPELEQEEQPTPVEEEQEEEVVEKKKTAKGKKPAKKGPASKKLSGRSNKISGRTKSAGSQRTKKKSGRNKQSDTEPKSKKTLLIAIIGIVVLTLGGGAGYYFFLMPQDDNRIKVTSNNTSTPPDAPRRTKANEEDNVSPLAFIPNNAKGIGSINLSKLFDLPMIQKAAEKSKEKELESVKESLNNSDAAADILEEIEEAGTLAFFKKRIKRVILAVDSSSFNENNQVDPIMLIETHDNAQETFEYFNGAIKESLVKDKLSSDAEVYKLPDDDKAYLAFLGPKLAIIGTESTVNKAIKAKEDGGYDNPDLEDTFDEYQDQLFWISWTSSGEKFMPDNPNMPISPNDIKAGLITLDYDDSKGLSLMAKITGPDNEKADMASKMLNQQLNQAKEKMGVMIPFPKGISIEANNKNLLLGITLSKEEIEAYSMMAEAAIKSKFNTKPMEEPMEE